LLGGREAAIYGLETIDQINAAMNTEGQKTGIDIHVYQSNHEGALIDTLHSARHDHNGVIFNPGGYTHTSVALRDAVSGIDIPVIEVHLSNIYAREEFRHRSLISPVCRGTITGFGWQSYILALQAMDRILGE